jgi:DNA-binding IclR family transcriptional regulator
MASKTLTSGRKSAATAAEPKPGANLQSLERAICLLRETAYSDAGLRLTELAELTSLSKSTVHRIVTWLVDHGLLQLSPQTRLYTPGSELYRLGQAAARHFSLVDLARPGMQRLAEATEDTVYLSVIDGDEAVCVERVTGAYPIKTLTLATGDRRPLGVGAGALALLAALPPAKAQGIIDDESRRAPGYTAFTSDLLHKSVVETRRRGYAYNPERVLKGMSAIGVPVQGPGGWPLCAISVAAISSRMNPKRRAGIVAQLQEEAAELARLATAPRPGGTL